MKRINPHAQALGRLGGSVKSKAKSAAARANGKLGGRPKKIGPDEIGRRRIRLAEARKLRWNFHGSRSKS